MNNRQSGVISKNLLVRFVTVVMFLFSAVGAYADLIHVSVSGMVCSFCAQGVEKRMRTLEGVSGVKVDLDSKVVAVTLKDESKVSDAQIQEQIKQAGFNVVTIHRIKE